MKMSYIHHAGPLLYSNTGQAWVKWNKGGIDSKKPQLRNSNPAHWACVTPLLCVLGLQAISVWVIAVLGPWVEHGWDNEHHSWILGSNFV